MLQESSMLATQTPKLAETLGQGYQCPRTDTVDEKSETAKKGLTPITTKSFWHETTNGIQIKFYRFLPIQPQCKQHFLN